MTRTFMKGFRYASTALLATLLVAAPVHLEAQDMAEEMLPPAQELVDRYVAAIGGHDAFVSVEGLRLTGTFQIPAMQLEGTVMIARSRNPERVVSSVELPGIGAIRSGFDGQVGWGLDPIQGPRLLSDTDVAKVRDTSSLSATVRAPEYYDIVETVGKAEMNGEECWQVRLMVKATGWEAYDCYSVESGLLVATVSHYGEGAEQSETTILVSEYRDFGGLLIPTVSRQISGSSEQVMVIEQIELGAMPAELFDLPDPIQALVTAGS